MSACDEPVLVETAAGLQIRWCIDPPHPETQDHRARFRCADLTWTPGQPRVSVTTTTDELTLV